MCGDDSETKGDSRGAGDSYHGDRVGGEGLEDSQGRRTPSQTAVIKHVSVSDIRVRIIGFYYYGHVTRITDTKKGGEEDGKEDFDR